METCRLRDYKYSLTEGTVNMTLDSVEDIKPHGQTVAHSETVYRLDMEKEAECIIKTSRLVEDST